MEGLASGSTERFPKRWEKKEDVDVITDPSDAHELIHEMFEKGERPVVSVPEQYANAIAKGLSPHATWIPGFSAIVGTFGRDAYIPQGEKRILLRVELDSDEQIEPRFTGPSKSYQGVVVLRGPIPANKLTRLDA